jgi:hypothetical protein
MRMFRLFNETKGKEYLVSNGVNPEIVDKLDLLGISSIANLLSAIKTAKYFEMTADDIIFTVFTDSADMYRSRLLELQEERGEYTSLQAAKDMEKCLHGITIDHIRELTYMDQKTIHNLKYFTWREQQEKEVEDLDQLWYDRKIWGKIFKQTARWDELIMEFNEMTGLLKVLS